MSGKESRGYKCVLDNIDTIGSSLRANSAAKAALIVKYQEKRWLDETIETLDETGLVRLVLNRISIDDNQYDIFIEMLKDIAGTDVIVDKLNGTTSYLCMKCVHFQGRNK